MFPEAQPVNGWVYLNHEGAETLHYSVTSLGQSPSVQTLRNDILKLIIHQPET